MAGVKESASSFSYAQAAMGRSSTSTSQDPSSKVTSGATTPVSGPQSDMMASSSWAEEMEETVPEKASSEQAASVKDSISTEAKDDAAEKPDSTDNVKTRNSSVSSPVMVESRDGEFPSAPNGAPQGSIQEESKAQDPKEGSWLQARADRQNAAQQKAEEPAKSEKKQKEPAPKPAPVVLHDAPPPSVNPWAKRVVDTTTTAKAKPAQAEPPKKPTAPVTAAKAAPSKENQRPKPEARKKASSLSAGSPVKEALAPAAPSSEATQESDKNAVPKVEEAPAKPPTSSRPAVNPWKQGTKSNIEGAGANTPAKAALPSVKDSKSWPTPDTQPEREQKPAATEKATTESKNDEENGTSKPRSKQQWKPMPVVPNILWETPGVGERRTRNGANGERGARGGGSLRGRGGASVRGGGNGGARAEGSTGDEETATGSQRGRPNAGRENAASTTKPARAASAGNFKERNNDSRTDRNSRNQGTHETRKGAPPANGTAATATANVSGAADSVNGGRRIKSPKQVDASTATDDVKVPEPIPRKTSVGTQTEVNGNVEEASTRETPQTGKGGSENRSRFEGPRDQAKDSGREFNWTGQSTRGGGKRGGRGRGGSREMANGHASHAFTNGHLGDFSPASQFATAQMPSGRGQYQNGFPQHPRGGWRGNASRSQSIPIDHTYPSRFYQQPSPMHPQMPAYAAYPYEYPVAPVGYEQFVDVNAVSLAVRNQIEYYFSLDNLLKDEFLRKQMDSQGFVLLEVIASFHRIKTMTTDANLIKAVCLQSPVVEIRVGDDGKERLRAREGWDKWILPVNLRMPGAQNDGPKELHIPQQPQPHYYGQPPAPMGVPQSAYPNSDRRSYDSNFSMMNGGPPSFFPGHHEGSSSGTTMNGDENSLRRMKSPRTFEPRSAANGALMNGQPAGGDAKEPDAFPNEQVEMLTVLVKNGGPKATQQPPFHSAGTRTFSDGSIDSKNVFGDAAKASEAKEPAPAVNGEAFVNGDSTSSRSQSPMTRSRNASRSPERKEKDASISLFWVKDSKTPVNSAPAGVTYEPYVQLRLKALRQRENSSFGSCPYDLEVLYQFWSHFLIRNFNDRMYNEFKYYANDDEHRGSKIGQKNLTKFYEESLRSQHNIRDVVAQDFAHSVESENKKDESLHFKALRSAWRDGALNLKNRKRVSEYLSQGLKEQLEG
ncbi:hypothetical protein MBLNU230_g1071t1 [Neophaeotheca triangularis]